MAALVANVAADGIAPNGARSSADTMLITWLDIFIQSSLVLNDFKNCFTDATPLFKMTTKSRSASIVNAEYMAGRSS